MNFLQRRNLLDDLKANKKLQRTDYLATEHVLDAFSAKSFRLQSDPVG